MKRIALTIAVLAAMLATGPSAFATNGDNLIAIGPIARAMGGVGIAEPQDAISAVFSNPAAMCFGSYCPSSQTDFAGTLFMPDISATITNARGTFTAKSEDNVYAIPAIGLSVPLTQEASNWRFGLAAYGATGLGVDYRETDIDQGSFYGPGFPMASGEYTQLQVMKFAPSIAWQPHAQWSLGLAAHVDYATLDLASGGSPGYGFGAQLGVIFKPIDEVSLGLTYITPQSVDHDKVADFDGDGKLDTLELAAPQQLGFGASYKTMDEKFLIEANAKWINWSSAAGYDDFDWEDQYVLALGVQYKPINELALRIGYNYADNPVKEHNNFNGSLVPGPGGMPMPAEMVNVQGKDIPRYYYETFRIIGFPGIIQHHLTLGIGYDFTEKFSMSLGYMHGFEETIRETGTDFAGMPVTLESKLSEQSIDFGLSWMF